MRRAATALFGLLAAAVATAQGADDIVKSLSIDAYTELAIKEGVRGREIAYDLSLAGYSRRIAFRQTDSPSATLEYELQRRETDTDGDVVQSDSRATRLRVQERTPLGTSLSGTLEYADTVDPAFSASVTQPVYLFTWNDALRSRQSADLAFANAKDAYQSSWLSVRASARSLYYDVMLGEETIKVEQRKVAASKKLLDITRALVQAGRTAAVETMRARLRALADERQLQNAVTSRDRAVLNAKNFILWPIEEPLEFETDLQFRPFAPAYERLVHYAEAHQPELRIARRARELAEFPLQEAKEGGRPNLNLTGSYGYSEGLSSTARGWALGGTVSWLFFDSLVTRDRVKQAKIGVWLADLRLHQAARDLRANIKNSYLEVRRAENQIKDFESERAQARRNVEVIRLRFQNGLERLIDVFDAENDMRNLETEYLGLLVSYNRAKDLLSQLVGADVEAIQ